MNMSNWSKFGMLVYSGLLGIYSSWVFLTIWNWFLYPLIGIKIESIYVAMAVSLVLNFIFSSRFMLLSAQLDLSLSESDRLKANLAFLINKTVFVSLTLCLAVILKTIIIHTQN